MPNGPRGYVPTFDDVLKNLDKLKKDIHNLKVDHNYRLEELNKDLNPEKGKFIITLEVGHGPHPDGFEPGAVDPISGKEEWKLNQICAAACKKYLLNNGFKDVEITDENNYLGSIGRNNSESHVFVSIHHNAFNLETAQGSETIVHDTKANEYDIKLAELCNKYFCEELKTQNRGVKKMSLSVIGGAISRWTPKQAVVLIEPYFITGKDVNGAHEDWSKRSGNALGKAIVEYFNG